MKKHFVLNLTIITLFSLSLTFAQKPSRLILNLTEEPATSIAVTWRTDEAVKEPVVEYAVATNWNDFKDNVKTTPAVSEEFKTGRKTLVFHHSAIIKGLMPETVYVYRVGAGKDWSEWNQFTTAATGANPFEFVYFGDPQNDLYEHCSRVFRQAFKTAPNAAFWLMAGDITTRPNDDLWGELFDAGGFIFRMTPSIMVPGNHDYLSSLKDTWKVLKNVNAIFPVHITQPSNGVPIEKLQETSFYVDYQGVRFIMIDSNTELEEQAEWMDGLLADNPNDWTVVSFHHPMYSTGGDRDNKQKRDILLPLFDKYGVDLVLQGHDHTYGRTSRMVDGKPTAGKGTVYVVSVTGPKMYDLNDNFMDKMVKVGAETQLFQTIKVDGNILSYKSYTVTGELFDSFELIK